jgi:hypothetical protein
MSFCLSKIWSPLIELYKFQFCMILYSAPQFWSCWCAMGFH